jgi:hypothetical protein
VVCESGTSATAGSPLAGLPSCTTGATPSIRVKHALVKAPPAVDDRDALRHGELVRHQLDDVVHMAAGVGSLARVEICVDAELQIMQRRVAHVRDRELETRDVVVARERPGERLLVHAQVERHVRFAGRVRVIHGGRLVVAIVGGVLLVRDHAEVLVDPAVAVVVAAIDRVLVDSAIVVVVEVPERPGLPGARAAHAVVRVQGRSPLEHRPARDAHGSAGGHGANPQLRMPEELVTAASRELERGVEASPLVEERVPEDARVRHAHGERTRV